jgi:PhnB protein
MSDIQVSTYINFQGRAREAMQFYQQALGGNLDLQTMDEQGRSKPAGPGDTIAYSRLDAAGAHIIGVDGHPNYPPKVGENMAVALSGTDKASLTRIFSELAEGGRIKMPLAAQPSGAQVGWLEDKFGISWMVSIESA